MQGHRTVDSAHGCPAQTPSEALHEPLIGRAAFHAAEAVIEHAQHAFLQVAQALMAIQAGRGYRHAGYTSWETYLDVRWPNISRGHAYRLIQAADVIESVVPGRHSDGPPFDFKHAAFLAPLPLEERRAIATAPNFASTPIAELYRRRRAARQDVEQLSVAIAEQRALTKPASDARVIAMIPDPFDEEVRIGLAESLPWADGSIDLVVTSPPYCLGDKVAYADGGDYADYDAYLELVARWARELFRVVNPDHGRACVDVPIDTDLGGWRPVAHHWQSALEAAGWQYRTTVVWNKGQAGAGTDRGSVDSAAAPNMTAPVEHILVYYRGSWYRNEKQEGRRSDLTHDEWLEWCGPRAVWNFPGEHDADHPAVFPDELARRCIKACSFVGDTVGDPFCGRGTTPRVSASLGRRVRGIDRSSTYVARAQAEVVATRQIGARGNTTRAVEDAA